MHLRRYAGKIYEQLCNLELAVNGLYNRDVRIFVRIDVGIIHDGNQFRYVLNEVQTGTSALWMTTDERNDVMHLQGFADGLERGSWKL